ncbi:phenylalanine 4-monooxygenase [Fretibacter rubidus]|uniref:phenylalanine 4-monooxygenase n=1 Tax=Fretibacter rubidus TaxID=570162 RepID=UPI00352B073A
MASKNRYADAPKNADYTIDQQWESYSAAEHDRWDRLFRRQREILPQRACSVFLDAMARLELSASGVPDMAELSDKLELLTGWRVVPVADLVPDDVFFDHLANKRFPAGAFIRPESEFDYLEEPDIFHDIFGHVPLLADPTFSAFMQAYGQGGLKAKGQGQLHNLARLYWYTVEFGLIKSPDGLRIFGAGILSSPKESVFSLDDPSPNRIALDLERVMRTKYIIDDFQQSYFVIDDFQSLLDSCYQNFEALYDCLRGQSDIDAHEVVTGDDVLHHGTHDYFKAKGSVAS